MGCCVVAIALISQLFALWRKLRSALGFPVREWYDDAPVPTARAIWLGRIRGLTRSTLGRSVLASLVVAELVFVGFALPGPDGLIAQHRQHLRRAADLLIQYGQWPDTQALICRARPGTISSEPPTAQP